MKNNVGFGRFVQGLFCAALCFGFAATGAVAAPFYVDLSGVANNSREDDGIAGNGEGGWSDEGINDMFLYPPVPAGERFVNGYHFKLIDPATSGGKDEVMLKPSPDGDAFGLPESVEVSVPDRKAKFVYFIQNAVNNKCPGDTVVAEYRVNYADGTSAVAPQRFGKELLSWWSRNWWDNSEDLAWPIYMGRNTYTMKYRFYIGIWATRWENPHPDKAIKSITLASRLAKCSPVIWGITLDDEDYFTDKAAREKDVWGSPAQPPEGYFDAKSEQELLRKYAAAKEMGFAKGIVGIDVLRPDLVAITVDAAFARDTRPSEGKIAKRMAEKPVSVSSDDDTAYKAAFVPEAEELGRLTFEYWNGNIGSFQQEFLYHHTLFVRLPSPMQPRKRYKFTIGGMDVPEGEASKQIRFGDDIPTPVIKVNQVAYFAGAKERYAYLGWWAGDLGAVDYSDFARFEVLDAKSGKVKLSGDIRKRSGTTDKMHADGGDIVYDMDIAALPKGSYRIRVPGLGSSADFDVGGAKIRDLYYYTQRVFLHQRCGQELKKPFADFERPACDLWVDKNGHMHDAPKDGEDNLGLQMHVGGYHDAGDNDCFTYHLRATQQDMDAFEMFPKAFKDGDLNLPEGRNRVPDILDEARWALAWYRDHQHDDGGVPKGRCNDSDSRRQSHLKWGDYGIFQPDRLSNLEFAATAATFARLYREHDKRDAETFLDAAKKAYAWAGKQPGDLGKEERMFAVWAASQLFLATGESAYQDDVRTYAFEQNGRFAFDTRGVWAPTALWGFASSDDPKVDPELKAKFGEQIIAKAKNMAFEQQPHTAYRFGGRRVAWASGNGGGHFAEPMLRAWRLTGDQALLDAASINADYQLGCNALSRTFMTGMGTRFPEHPQLNPALYEKPNKLGKTLKGVVVFGVCDNRNPPGWYPAEIPGMRRYRDLGSGGAEVNSEFTITETTGCNAMLYAILYALSL